MLEDQSADSWLRHQPCNAKTSRDNGYYQQHELIPGRRGLRSLVKSVERSSETSTSTYNLALHTVFHLLPGGHFTPHVTARDLAMERSVERTALLQEQGLRSGHDGCTSGQRGGRQYEAKNTKRGYCSSAHVCTVTVRHALPSRFMNVQHRLCRPCCHVSVCLYWLYCSVDLRFMRYLWKILRLMFPTWKSTTLLFYSFLLVVRAVGE